LKPQNTNTPQTLENLGFFDRRGDMMMMMILLANSINYPVYSEAAQYISAVINFLIEISSVTLLSIPAFFPVSTHKFVRRTANMGKNEKQKSNIKQVVILIIFFKNY